MAQRCIKTCQNRKVYTSHWQTNTSATCSHQGMPLKFPSPDIILVKVTINVNACGICTAQTKKYCSDKYIKQPKTGEKSKIKNDHWQNELLAIGQKEALGSPDDTSIGFYISLLVVWIVCPITWKLEGGDRKNVKGADFISENYLTRQEICVRSFYFTNQIVATH